METLRIQWSWFSITITNTGRVKTVQRKGLTQRHKARNEARAPSQLYLIRSGHYLYAQRQLHFRHSVGPQEL